MYQTSRLNTAAKAAHQIKADFLEQREPLLRLGLVLTSPFLSTIPLADSYWQKQVIAFFAAANSRREQLAVGLQPAGNLFKL